MAIIDCDVHQGNGTAAIFADEPDVYTFSIHGANNYPLVKVPGSLDIGLPDGTGDEEYLRALEPVIPKILSEFRPGLVFYLAGVDPHERDAWDASDSRTRACASAMSSSCEPAVMPASRWPSRWAAAMARTSRTPWRPTAIPSVPPG